MRCAVDCEGLPRGKNRHRGGDEVGPEQQRSAFIAARKGLSVAGIGRPIRIAHGRVDDAGVGRGRQGVEIAGVDLGAEIGSGFQDGIALRSMNGVEDIQSGVEICSPAARVSIGALQRQGDVGGSLRHH